jgi:hypothetical protein
VKYRYVSAWAIIGGINLPVDSEPILLSFADNERFYLTKDPSSELAEVDRGAAIGRLMLKSMFGQRGPEELAAAIQTEIKLIRDERAARLGQHAVLLALIQGEQDGDVIGDLNQVDNCFFAIDAFEKSPIKQRYSRAVESIKLAIGLEGTTLSKFELLADGIYALDDFACPIHSFKLSMSADLAVSSPISAEGAARISENFRKVASEIELESVQRLMAQMSDAKVDRLKAFLSGWTALEILVAKAFKTSEEVFLSPLSHPGPTTLRERFLVRLKQVMKDKYRLLDKFLAVTVVLFPDADADELEANYAAFSALKSRRDSMFHGGHFVDSDLPLNELSTMLNKYVSAYVALAAFNLK